MTISSPTTSCFTITIGSCELVVAHVVNSLSTQGTALQFDAVVVWRVVDGQVLEAWDIPAVNTAHRQSAIDRA